MRYVGVGRRFLAVFIDGVIILVMSGPFADISRGPGYFQMGFHGRHVLWPGAIAIVYSLFLEGVAGATIGKFVTGIRVVREDGSKLDWSSALIRNIARIVDAFPYAFPYVVGAIAVWSSPTKQRLGDRWANTVVVTKDSLLPRGSTTYPSGVVGDWQQPIFGRACLGGELGVRTQGVLVLLGQVDKSSQCPPRRAPSPRAAVRRPTRLALPPRPQRARQLAGHPARAATPPSRCVRPLP